MLSKHMRIGAAATFVFTMGLVANAQQAVPPQRVGKVQVQPVQSDKSGVVTTQTYRAKEILGSKILIQNNTSIGTVDDIVFDEAGNLEYLIVANDEKLVSVPWEAARFDMKSQSGLVNITPEVYKTLPTFTTSTYPQFFTPTYRTTTYKYYGLTPRALRRMERIIRP